MDSGSAIGIVGAGPSGLAVAWELAERGLENLTVLEQSARPGGKCLTRRIGEADYELGATFAYGEGSSPIVAKLAKLLGIRTEGAVLAPIQAFRLKSGCVDDAWLQAAIKALRDMQRESAAQEISGPGWEKMPSEFFDSVGGWLRRRGIDSSGVTLLGTTTGFGFVTDDIPAGYHAKMAQLVKGVPFFFPGTLQAAFEGLAGWLRNTKGVRFNFGVEGMRIERGDSAVGLTWVAGGQRVEESFDRVIVCIPPDEISRSMDLVARERRSLAELRYMNFATAVVQAQGLPSEAFSWALVENLRCEEAGRVVTVSNARRSADVHLVYQYGSFKGRRMPDSELDARLLEDFEKLGARGMEVLHRHRWENYFPHVGERAAREGFFADVAGWQGRGGVFFAGSWLDAETVERAMQQGVAVAGQVQWSLEA